MVYSIINALSLKSFSFSRLLGSKTETAFFLINANYGSIYNEQFEC